MTKFVHLRSTWYPGAVTIAVTHEDDLVNYGVSYCSPKDSFCKNTGRAAAEERMVCLDSGDRSAYSGDFMLSSGTHKELVYQCLLDTLGLEEYPSFARKILCEHLWQYA